MSCRINITHAIISPRLGDEESALRNPAVSICQGNHASREQPLGRNTKKHLEPVSIPLASSDWGDLRKSRSISI